MNKLVKRIGATRRILWKKINLFFGAKFGKYVCPLCGHKVLGFDPLSIYYSYNYIRHGHTLGRGAAETCNRCKYSCPICNARDRERLYALYLNQYFNSLDIDRKYRVLDIAPAKALTDFIRRKINESYPNLSYRSADLSSELADDKVDLMDMRIYKSDSFDFFICSHVLEHVRDDRKAISELFRILKPGCEGILMVPINLIRESIDEDPDLDDIKERWRRFGQSDHIRAYSKKGFIDRVENSGFVIKQLDFSYFGEDTFKNHGIAKQSVLYVVKK